MIETIMFERFCVCLVCVCVCVYVCVCLWNRLFLFQAHKSLAISCYEFLPSVDIERGYASKSGAVDAGGVFLCVGLKSLEMVSLKRKSSRDLVVWNGCLERLCSSAPNLS